MPASEREASRDRDGVVRHQQFFPHDGRQSVPMSVRSVFRTHRKARMQLLTSIKRRWDSSDPERAPPPLPFPPGAASPTTKANTSAGIAAAAKQIVEKARESAPISSYTSSRDITPQTSPDRSLVRGSHHRRLQTLATSNVRDLRNHLDSKSPERSPERPSSSTGLGRQKSSDSIVTSPSPFDRESSGTPTPSSRERGDPLKDTPTLRPSTRPPPRPLMGENTPPSATMLALREMVVPEQPLNDITNGPSTPTPSRPSTSVDFSSQLLNLTTIATNLQREMAQLSRRSKDNATDLFSLKESANKRDEDIRKSLRELATGMNGPSMLGPPPAPGSMSRSASSFANILDNKPWTSPPSGSKTYPRAASAHSFLDDARVASPSPYSVEGAASVAMLEKIIREMVTKEGQERLQTSLSELLEKNSAENTEAAKKVEELSQFIKETSQNQALVHMSKDGPPRLDLNLDSPGLLSKTRDANGKEAQMIGGDDEIVKILEHIKKSIGHTGGTTAEVKNIVRDLRGEVLGMGRDLGRKLDIVSEASLNNELDRSIEKGQGKLNAEEVQRIIEEGMEELKAHIAGVLLQRAEQDDEPFKQLATRSGPDSEEIFSVVKHALSEHGTGLVKRDVEDEEGGLDRETVLDAVREGLRDFEPNIELQQFGLERDEILTVLKEGLEDYQNNQSEPNAPPMDKAAIYEVMQEAMKDFQAPMPHDQIAHMKEDILASVQQALSEHQPAHSVAEVAIDSAAISAAVQEAMVTHGPSAPRELDISRDDLFDAVKASLDGTSVPFGGLGEQVLSQLHELFDNMKAEFQQYTAANGRDTEQVLDAVKDGLESLRGEIERYVDRAQDVTGKDEIEECVRSGLEQLRVDVQGYVAQGPTEPAAKSEVLDYIKSEFEHLHAVIGERDASRSVPQDAEPKAGNSNEILEALREHIDELKTHVSTSRSLDNHSDGDGPSEEMLDAMKEEFDQLKDSLLNANAHDKSELLETIQDSMGALHSKLNGSELSGLSGGATEDIIAELRAEFAALKESLHDVASGEGDRDAVVNSVRQAIDDLRTQLSADQSDASAEALGAIKEQLEKFQAMMGGAVVLGAAAEGTSTAKGLHDDTLSELRSTLDEVKEAVAAKSSGAEVSDDLLEALRGEFENLRNSMASSVVNTGFNEEVLDAVRVGIDDLRSHVDKKLDNPDAGTSQHGELLDAINDGLETLRGDIVKTLDKPLDMTVNYEILDTLKDGLAGLRADMDKMKSADGAKSGEIVLAEGDEVAASRDLPSDADAGAATSTDASSAGFEKMEVLLTQLQIKVEALSQELPGMKPDAPAEGTAMKDDLVALEGMLQDVQANVTILANKEESASDSAARKEDTDAIETILRNTKAQLEEVAEATISGGANKEQMDGVEAVVRMTQETVDSMAEKLESTAAAKADVAVVEVLAQDLKIAVDELKERIPVPSADEEKPELMTKADLDVLGVMCTEIKQRVNDMVLPDPEELPAKADIEQLHGLITDFRESHDKLRESYESDIGVTAKAFDDRRKEFEDTVAQITQVKENLGEIKDEILAKMGDGDTSFETIGEMLRGIEEKSADVAGAAAMTELVDKVTQEFERAHSSLEAMKIDQQTAAETSLEKHAETKDAMTTEIGEKLETYFDSIMSKYDDAQHGAEEKAKAMEEKVAAQEDLLSSTKAMAEELRLSIDTLGGTMTSLPETVEKMTEESKTVFNRVDDTYNKLDETQEGLKYEHTVTRDEVAKVMAAIDGLQADASDHNPRFMVALKEVQALIGQHYEHSQRASDAAAEHAQAVKDLQEQVKGLGTQNEDLKTHVSALPALTAAPAIESTTVPPNVEKYDDTAMHEKLDKLMGHAEDATNASTQLERLDQIHEKVMATAAEVSAFVAVQTKQITEDHSTKQKEAEELALLLERRQVQKDEVEDDITVLNEEKDSLRTAVEALKAEKEALTTQKSRLTADVSALETAMQIRRDELHDMDRKAEAIERRMLEGVMNQSRMLLLAKGTPKASTSPRKSKPQGRDLRVPSSASAVSAQTVTPAVPSLQSSHALAMKSRPTIHRNVGGPAAANTAGRRIMSLNQINNNAAGRTVPAPASLLSGGPQGLKRSHSVKTQGAGNAFRKPSWATGSGRRELSLASATSVNSDKENASVAEDVEGEEEGDENFEDAASDAQTERRTSYLSGTETTRTYDGTDADAITPGLESEDGTRMSYTGTAVSDMSYMTGSSYLTGSDVDYGRTSLGSSVDGVVGGDQSTIEEEGPDHDGEVEESVAGSDAAPLRLEAGEEADTLAELVEGKKDIFDPHRDADSGLGTDIPTAALSSVGGDGGYFRGE